MIVMKIIITKGNGCKEDDYYEKGDCYVNK